MRDGTAVRARARTSLAPGWRRHRRVRTSRHRVATIGALLLLMSSAAAMAAVVLPAGVPGPGPQPQFTISLDVVHNTGALTAARTSIAVSPSGVPWISFYDGGPQDLMVASMQAGGGCTNIAWKCEVVDGAGMCGAQCNAGEDSSIRVGSDGVVHLTFRNTTAARLVYSNNSGGVWGKIPIATAARYPSLALDSSDRPSIAYYNTSTTDLYVATYVGASGTGCLTPAWTCRRVEQVTGVTGLYPSLAINSSGEFQISHFNQSAGNLRYAISVVSGGNCGSGFYSCSNVEVVDPNIIGTSIASSATGPRLAYFIQSAGTQLLRVARWIGGGSVTCGLSTQFDCITVYDTGGIGSFPSAAVVLDDQWKEHVGFYDPTSDLLSVAHYDGSSVDCGGAAGWHCDAIAGAMLRPSVAIGPSPGDTFWLSADDGGGLIGAGKTTANVPEIGALAVAGAASVIIVLASSRGHLRAGRRSSSRPQE